MPIKLIVSDMDGTLLNENIEISNRSTEAILRAQEAGIEFAIATGRTVDTGYSLVKEQGITCPFIELNGARLFDHEENLQFTRAIEKEDIKTLIDILDDYDVHHEFITQEGTYSNRPLEEYIQSSKVTFQSLNEDLSDEEVTDIISDRLSSLNIRTVDDYDFLYQDTSLDVLKTLANAGDNLSLLHDVQHHIEETMPGLIVTSASTHNIEINNIRANKGQAVAEYAQARGYSASEVITIGDNINDLTMLRWAEHSYAVANGHSQAKKAARYGAPSHVDDAVAQVIERVLDGKSFQF